MSGWKNVSEGWKNVSEVARSLTERARKIVVRGHTPNFEYHGSMEVMCDKEGNMCISVEDSEIKKFGGKKWHTRNVYLTLSPEAWEHIRNAPTTVKVSEDAV